MTFCGTAFTVVCHPRDNIMLQVAISYAQPGDVLVVSSGDQPAGQFGDVLANACAARGIAALVTDGGVRDTREIRELGFPVFAQYVCIQGTVKESLGPVNQPLVLGGQLVRPGDVVKGDCDGVVVIAREDVAGVVDACRVREEAEAGYIRRYRDGETPLTVSGLTEVLRAKGLTVDLP
jgi:4-hydroxy-4-methyl-2-oxoglutarate aldolase